MLQNHLKQLLHYLLVPTAVFMLGFSLFYAAGFDFVLASALFELEGGQWRLTNHWLLSDVLHNGGRFLNNLLVVALLLSWFYQQFLAKHKSERRQALGKLVLSLLLSFALVAVIKRLLPAECPWDLQQFGGHQPFIGIFAGRPDWMPSTQCFPAGHASVGYAWVALYFYFLPLCARKACLGLTLGLLLGILFGSAQQLRGAHFFSHDLTTLWLCWCVSTLVYLGYPKARVSLMPAVQEQYDV
ncbi:phosphatase PAP2 family protein [Rheinheimera sp. 4Y26]|uniref:phosphatase PAP2 family protein n=1 Tax=Rheinheimera sp. 4Y26 TaxID=2977811 RepID=UPI0021B0AB33|nr:phosphatase PAP2 family protein [Rheinheimera sp. 4Y26]MCT6701224.1 phosphatase PAP2 family protein [Rheinheimera sp. 4Y26]